MLQTSDSPALFCCTDLSMQKFSVSINFKGIISSCKSIWKGIKWEVKICILPCVAYLQTHFIPNSPSLDCFFSCATSQLQIHLSQNKSPLHITCPYLLLSQPAPQLLLEEVGLSVSVGVQTSSQEILSNTYPQSCCQRHGCAAEFPTKALRMKSPTGSHTFSRSTLVLSKNNQHITNTDNSKAWVVSILKTFRFVGTSTTHIPHGN